MARIKWDAVGAHKKKIKKIPKKTWKYKAWSTVVGAGAITLGIAIEKWLPHIDDKVLYALLIFGGYSIAGDLVRSFAGFLPTAIRDVRNAIKGNGANASSDDQASSNGADTDGA
jgi:hypothetical protein